MLISLNFCELGLALFVARIFLPLEILLSSVLSRSVFLLLDSFGFDVLEGLLLKPLFSLAFDVLIQILDDICSLFFDVSLPLLDRNFAGFGALARLEILLVLPRLLEFLGVLLQLLFFVVSDLHLGLHQTTPDLGHHGIVFEHLSKVVLRSIEFQTLRGDSFQPHPDIAKCDIVELHLSLDVVIDIYFFVHCDRRVGDYDKSLTPWHLLPNFRWYPAECCRG